MADANKIKRKILMTGNYTYLVTLPKEWVKQLKWRAKQAVELELKGETIVVRDFDNTKS